MPRPTTNSKVLDSGTADQTKSYSAASRSGPPLTDSASLRASDQLLEVIPA
jgi:hypothetical protein